MPPSLSPTHPTELLTKDEEAVLICRAQQGDQLAMEELVHRNQRLINRLARGFADPVRFPLEDACQEGSIGFIRAVEKFDLSTGNKLSTYACHWIRQALQRGRDSTEDLIRVPTHVKELLAKLRRARARLTQTLCRDPTTNELATEAGLSVKVVEQLADVPSGWRSLDEQLNGHGENPGDALFFVDLVADPVPGPDSDVRLAEFDLKQVVKGILELLDDKTADILRRRFGFPPYYEPQTLAEIAAAFGQSRENIRQRERVALQRARVLLGMSKELKQSRRSKEERDRTIVAAIQAGDEVEAVALRFNIQVRRVRQIVRDANKTRKS